MHNQKQTVQHLTSVSMTESSSSEEMNSLSISDKDLKQLCTQKILNKNTNRIL